MKSNNRLDQWLADHGYTYAEFGRVIGVSRQYARRIAVDGAPGLVKPYKVIQMCAGEIELIDLLDAEGLREVKEEGYDTVVDDLTI